MIKETIYWNNITIINIYALKIEPKLHKQKLSELKLEQNNTTIKVDFNTSLKIIDRTTKK